MTTTTQPRIELPRHEGESDRAYAARIAYVTMGPGRSLDKVVGLQESGKRASGHIFRWSQQYGWVESARQYDDQVAYLTLQEAADRYRADLEDHRKRYGQSGKALHALASAYISKLAQRMQALDSEELKPGRIANDVRTVAAALTVAADLEAHALRVAELLPRLSDESDRQ